MLLIGLTGGIASGKSLVSSCFESLGIQVIDADVLAREVVAPGSSGLASLVSRFSTEILTSRGDLDRAKLRELIFNNPSEKKIVEDLLHPLIRQLSESRIDAARTQARPYVVYAVPLLLETGQQERFDRIVVVDIPVSLQMERLVQRDGGTADAARKIVNAQSDRQARLAIADDVIDNTGTEAETRMQVEQLHQRYMKLSLNQVSKP